MSQAKKAKKSKTLSKEKSPKTKEKQRGKGEILINWLKNKLETYERSSTLVKRILHEKWRKSRDTNKGMDDIIHQTEKELKYRNINDSVVTVEKIECKKAQLQYSLVQKIHTLQLLQRERMDHLQQEWDKLLDTIQEQFQLEQEDDDNVDLSLFQELYSQMMSQMAENHRHLMESCEILIENMIWFLDRYPEKRQVLQQNLTKDHDARKAQLEYLIKENKVQTESLNQKLRHVEHLQKKTVRTLGHKTLDQDLNFAKVSTYHVKANVSALTRPKLGKDIVALCMDSDVAEKKLQNVINAEKTILDHYILLRKLEDKLQIPPPGIELTENEENPGLWEYQELNFLTARQKSALLQQEVLKKHRNGKAHENAELRLKIQQLQQQQGTMLVEGHSFQKGPKPKHSFMY